MSGDDPMTDECPIVAVVNGDIVTRTALCTLLEKAGLTVKLFESSEEYLRTSQSCAPNCIVLEPGPDGFDLQAKFTKMKCQTPVIFVTGDSDIRMSVRAMKAGAIEYLVEPFRDRELLDAVKSGIEQDHARRANYSVLSEIRNRFAALTPREREIMILLSAGKEAKEIASQIGICTHTARVHSNRVMSKMGARSTVDLARMADKLEHSAKSGMVRPVEKAASPRPNLTSKIEELRWLLGGSIAG